MSPNDPHQELARERSSLLPRLSLDRPIGVIVLLASVLVVGLVATLGIPIELVPKGFSEPFLRVMVPWRDAPATEVLEKVVRPLEEELSTTPGLDRINSSSATGSGRLFLRFKQGTDMDVAYREVRDRVERAKRRLPDDVERVYIRKDDDTGIPIFVLGLAIDDSISAAYDLIQNEVILPLERIDGVAAVDVDGLVEKEVLIELDRERATAAGIDIWTLAQELGQDNFSLASGQVHAGDRKLLLRLVATYDDLDALRARPLSPTVRLGDVATIRYDVPEAKFRVRAMSKPAVAVVVRKEGDANTLEVAQRVQEAVARFAENPRLKVIETTELFNQRKVILESLDTLLSSGKIGALFAILVLFFFLRRLRMTLIITLSIPLSLLVALAVMFFSGESLNIISLLALMISVGLLVDNSVVVAENIFRLHRQGMGRRDACIKGASQIALAIVMATLTTVIVFLPASLVEGQAQFFLLRLSVPISVSLLASLVVALVLIPLALFATLPDNHEPSPLVNSPAARTSVRQRLWERLDAVLRAAYSASFGRINDGYGRLLAFSLRRRFDVMLVVTLILAATIGLFAKTTKFVGVQDEERGGFQIQVELPPATTFREAEAYFLEAEKAVEGLKEELDLAGWFVFHRTTFGRIEGWFESERTNTVTPREATQRVLAVFPERAGVTLYSGEDSEDDDKDEKVFALRLYGDDPDALEKLAVEVESVLTAVPGVLGAKKAADRPSEELALVVDRARAQRLGVDPEVAAGIVGYALRGQALPRFSWDGRQIPVRVRFAEEDRNSLGKLEDFVVPSATGELVSLSSLVTPEVLPASQQIWRTDKRTSRTITLELAEDDEEATRARLERIVGGIDWPEGITRGAPSTQAPDEDLNNLLGALLISVILIYLLMAFLFESFVLPLSIVVTMPLGFVGVAWAHVISDLDIDFLGTVGIVLLIGVVVNNGIVLIDYVHRLVRAGHGRDEALLLAAHRRFRPILMTALTTICGMVPLLTGGTTSIGLSYTSFGLTLVGGMTTATALTLLVVPIVYTVFDDLRRFAGALASRMANLRRSRGNPIDQPLG